MPKTGQAITQTHESNNGPLEIGKDLMAIYAMPR